MGTRQGVATIRRGRKGEGRETTRGVTRGRQLNVTGNDFHTNEGQKTLPFGRRGGPVGQPVGKCKRGKGGVEIP